jgi:hypothetical protein
MRIKWENYEVYVDDIVSDGLYNAIACRWVHTKAQSTHNMMVNTEWPSGILLWLWSIWLNDFSHCDGHEMWVHEGWKSL